MQEIAFFMDDMHTSSLYLMRLGSTDFIMRVRATSYIDQNVWHPSLFNTRNQAHYCLISWLDLHNDKIFWQAELISTRFVLKRQPFSPFFRWSKKVCVCVAVMYVRLFEHLLFQLTVHTKTLNIQKIPSLWIHPLHIASLLSSQLHSQPAI